MMRAKVGLRDKKVRSSGRTVPASSRPASGKIGIMPGYIHKPGQGRRVISRRRHPHLRGSLAAHLARAGPEHLHRHRRDPINARAHRRRADVHEDPDTEAIIPHR